MVIMGDRENRYYHRNKKKIAEKRNGNKEPQIDHNHETGKVRALLCGPCNVALGGFRESPTLLRAAAEYIESHEGIG